MVFEMVKNEGFYISNIDCTIILQKPKIKMYIEDMKKTVAHILNINLDQINIKATTEEGLGFTGECLGVATHAVALVYKK